MSQLLPLFPLQLVVFPGAAAPLHIFEERYKEMVGEAEAHRTEFGIVRSISRDGETGIAGIGCTATVESVVHRYPDGRFDIVARGRRRFRVLSLNDEEACLRATVEFFDDEPEPPLPAELVDRAMEAHRRLQQSAEDKPGADGSAAQIPSNREVSFILAEDIDDLDFRSAILQSTSEAERLQLFARFAAGYLPRKQYVEHMKKKAPTNGAGHHGPATQLQTD